jgi:hypothetical protein
MHAPDKTSWLIALVVPFLAAGAGWVWMSATLDTHACATGAGGGSGGPGLAGVALLVLAGPIATGIRGWRARAAPARTTTAAVASMLLAVPLVYLTLAACWASHGCYT